MKRNSLSNKQWVFLGAFISIACGRNPYPAIKRQMEERGFIHDNGTHCEITYLGQSEFDKYLKFSGLMMDKQAVQSQTSLRKYVKRVCDRPSINQHSSVDRQ